MNLLNIERRQTHRNDSIWPSLEKIKQIMIMCNTTAKRLRHRNKCSEKSEEGVSEHY